MSRLGLHHVAVETRRSDVEKAIAFYAMLGFEHVPEPPQLADVARWVERDGLQVHLLFADEPVVPERGHFAVICPDYEATQQRLRAAGAEVQDHLVLWDSPRCYAFDPTGHRVEIMQFPPGG